MATRRNVPRSSSAWPMPWLRPMTQTSAFGAAQRKPNARRSDVGFGVNLRKIKTKPLPKSRRGSLSGFDQYTASLKFDTPLLGPVQRHLIHRRMQDERPQDVIHPSELCKRNVWCIRRAFYNVTGVPPSDEQKFTMNVEYIFAEGHNIHDKWATWFWQIGTLQGIFKCHSCGWRGWETAPKNCPGCGLEAIDWRGPRALRYMEVPVIFPELYIKGRADGMTDELYELKSVGAGTVRVFAPSLYERYDQGKITLDRLFSELRRPFNEHVRQGMFYAWCRERDVMRFIYDWKPSGIPKEFEVKVDEEFIADMIENATDAAWHIDQGRLPARPRSVKSPDSSLCKPCTHRTICWKDHDADEAPTLRIRRSRHTA